MHNFSLYFEICSPTHPPLNYWWNIDKNFICTTSRWACFDFRTQRSITNWGGKPLPHIPILLPLYISRTDYNGHFKRWYTRPSAIKYKITSEQQSEMEKNTPIPIEELFNN